MPPSLSMRVFYRQRDSSKAVIRVRFFINDSSEIPWANPVPALVVADSSPVPIFYGDHKGHEIKFSVVLLHYYNYIPTDKTINGSTSNCLGIERVSLFRSSSLPGPCHFLLPKIDRFPPLTVQFDPQFHKKRIVYWSKILKLRGDSRCCEPRQRSLDGDWGGGRGRGGGGLAKTTDLQRPRSVVFGAQSVRCRLRNVKDRRTHFILFSLGPWTGATASTSNRE